MVAIALLKVAGVTWLGSSPLASMTRPTASDISLSSVTLPFSFGLVSRSLIDVSSPPVLFGS